MTKLEIAAYIEKTCDLLYDDLKDVRNNRQVLRTTANKVIKRLEYLETEIRRRGIEEQSRMAHFEPK